MNYLNLLKNKGHQRLWLVASICWMLAAGFIFWKPLPEHQAVDVFQEATAFCQAENNAKAQVAGDQAYQACMAKNENAGVNTSEALLGTTAKLTEAICAAQRSAIVVDNISKANSNNFGCVSARGSELERSRQLQADRLVDSLRTEKLFYWLVVTFLPPIALPLGVVLFLYSASAMMGWIAAGYKDKK